jgi:D-serine dehydratase
LFLGYSHGAALLARQLEDRGINVGCDSPIVVYLPCGVGGAPGGLTLGLKLAFGDAVACVFVEPTQSPCFMVQLMAGKEHPVSVYDIGLTNKTVADGLAVPSASLLAANLVEKLVDGCVTVSERAMLESTAWLQMRNFPIEPSAASALSAVPLFLATCLATSSSRLRSFAAASATHIVWSTGRSTPDTDTLLAKTFKDWITHRGLERIR